MSYTPPVGTAADASWVGADAYTAPAGTAADAQWAGSSVSGTGAATLDIAASAVGTSSVTITGAGAVALDVTPDATGAHGVSGAGVATLGVDESGAGAHGVSGAEGCTLTVVAAVVAVHERYEVRGEVRLGGILVNRRVRCYLRDTGALVGDVDTVVGRFQIHTGFEPREHYIVPIHLDDAATDWTPPIANRVTSVLAQDV